DLDASLARSELVGRQRSVAGPEVDGASSDGCNPAARADRRIADVEPVGGSQRGIPGRDEREDKRAPGSAQRPGGRLAGRGVGASGNRRDPDNPHERDKCERSFHVLTSPSMTYVDDKL